MGVRLLLRSAFAQVAPAGVAYEFDQERVVIGRGAGADVRIPHRTVSEAHATIQLHGGGYAIEDLDATNGTHVNGTRLVPRRPRLLKEGDEITCGDFVLAFHTGIAQQLTTMERTASLARRMLRESIAPASPEAAPPRLRVIAGPDAGEALSLSAPPYSVVAGRGEGCGWRLLDDRLSAACFEVVRDLDGVLIRDLGSNEGLSHADKRFRERRLRHGDEIVAGATRLRFEDPAEAAILALVGEPDVKSTPTHTLPQREAPPAAGSADEAGGDAPDTPLARDVLATPPPAQTAPWLGADALIYLLAAIVLALSLVGLFILLHTS